jgi:hypothetical protein
MVEKLTKDFRDFEKDLGMQKNLVKRRCQRKSMLMFLQGSKM